MTEHEKKILDGAHAANEAARTTRKGPPKNLIVPEKKVDEFTRKLDGIILDQATQMNHQNMMTVSHENLKQLVRSVRLWNAIQFVIILALLVLIGIMASVNTGTIQGWN